MAANWSSLIALAPCVAAAKRVPSALLNSALVTLPSLLPSNSASSRSARRPRCNRPCIGPSGGGGPSMCAKASVEPPITTAAPSKSAILIFLFIGEVSERDGRQQTPSASRNYAGTKRDRRKVWRAGPGANFAMAGFAAPVSKAQITFMIKEETKPHILVVEDARDIREPLGRYLRDQGYRATTAADAVAARKVMKGSAIDLVVLDIMMPGEDGLSLCRSIRETSQIPVILLTARGEEVDRIIGLEMGADDYIAKPFSPRELIGRVAAVLRCTPVQLPLLDT